jgi:hypothetical protein
MAIKLDLMELQSKLPSLVNPFIPRQFPREHITEYSAIKLSLRRKPIFLIPRKASPHEKAIEMKNVN